MIRLSALRVASAFRTVSADAVSVIAGLTPTEILADERRSLYLQRRSTQVDTHEEIRTQVRNNSVARWQTKWDASSKRRWTHRPIPEVKAWQNRNHGEVNYYVTQILTGHGCFRAYLFKYNHKESPYCQNCKNVPDDAEHVVFHCPRFNVPRGGLEDVLGYRITVHNLVIKAMLESV